MQNRSAHGARKPLPSVVTPELGQRIQTHCHPERSSCLANAKQLRSRRTLQERAPPRKSQGILPRNLSTRPGVSRHRETLVLHEKIIMQELLSRAARKGGEGGPMQRCRNRFARNPYFQFHPLHSTFSLLAALVLFGLLAWFITWMPS